MSKKAKEIKKYLLSRSFNAGEAHGDCFHAEHVVRAMNHYEALLKEVAEMAFDAGIARSNDYYNSGRRGLEMKCPDKYTFINDLFNPS